MIEDIQDSEFLKEYRRLKPAHSLIPQIINRRCELGLSQKELAELSGINKDVMFKIENGEHNTKISTLISIAEALNSEIKIELIPFDRDD